MPGKSTVIIIDPKGERRLLARAAAEAHRHQKPFAVFMPAFPQQSASMNVLEHARTPLEVVSLIRTLMPASNVAIFEEFPVGILERLAEAQQVLGIPWTLEGLRQVAMTRRRMEALLASYLSHLGCFAPGGLKACIKEYVKQGVVDPVADALIEDAEWPAEHHRKITAALLPMFRGVVGGTIGPLLSPSSPQLSWTRIIQRGMVVYMGLGSLRTPDVSNRIARLLVQGLILYLGYRYDYEDIAQTAPISVIVDEAGDVLYPSMINALNKGGGANGRFILGMQSKADPEEMLSPAQTRRIFDNLNTQVCFRLADMQTALSMTEGLTCAVATPQQTVGLAYGGMGGLTGHASQRDGVQRSAFLDPGWVLGLPRGHAFCRIAGGWWKLAVPQLTPVPLALLDQLGLAAMWRSMDPNHVLEGELVCETSDSRPASRWLRVRWLRAHWPLPPSRQLPSPAATLLAGKSSRPRSWSFSQARRRVLKCVRAMVRRRVPR